MLHMTMGNFKSVGNVGHPALSHAEAAFFVLQQWSSHVIDGLQRAVFSIIYCSGHVFCPDVEA
jgi:hypothetical protein